MDYHLLARNSVGVLIWLEWWGQTAMTATKGAASYIKLHVFVKADIQHIGKHGGFLRRQRCFPTIGNVPGRLRIGFDGMLVGGSLSSSFLHVHMLVLFISCSTILFWLLRERKFRSHTSRSWPLYLLRHGYKSCTPKPWSLDGAHLNTFRASFLPGLRRSFENILGRIAWRSRKWLPKLRGLALILWRVLPRQRGAQQRAQRKPSYSWSGSV